MQVHAAQVAHLDIKPDNILMANQGASAILADFRTAQHQTATATTALRSGSENYMAPEMFALHGDCEVDITGLQRADMYSVGVTLHELHFGTVPKRHVRRPAMLPQNDTVGAPLREMILALLHADPSQRPTASQALACDYFNRPLTSAEKECAICMCEVFAENGVVCPAGKHFYCDDCLAVRVSHYMQSTVNVTIKTSSSGLCSPIMFAFVIHSTRYVFVIHPLP